MNRTARPVHIFAGLALVLTGACGGEETAQSAAQTAAGAAQTMMAAAETPADAYAPRLPIPGDLPDDPGAELMVMAMRSVVIPSKSEVGVPAYPGARIMSTMAASTMTVNGEEIETMPALAMLSEDEIADVVKFYMENLEGWHQKEFFGNYMFWDGPADANPLDISLPYPLVGIMALDESSSEAAFWPGVKTRVDIRYRPPGD